jgi:DNA-binding response OmpR family regulator
VNPGGRSFLVVDDEEEMCWVLAHVLTRNGYACETAHTGQDANALVRRQSFCLAFLDAKLPDVDGLELARQLRISDPGLPIILISGYFYQDNMTVQDAVESGLINAFFSKPFDHSEILRAIDSHGRRQGSGSPQLGK